MTANVKSKFAKLKYEQLLTEKYFVETCFSKRYESYTQRNQLRDWYMEMRMECCEKFATTTLPEEIECTTTTTTTTTTSTTTTTTIP